MVCAIVLVVQWNLRKNKNSSPGFESQPFLQIKKRLFPSLSNQSAYRKADMRIPTRARESIPACQQARLARESPDFATLSPAFACAQRWLSLAKADSCGYY